MPAPAPAMNKISKAKARLLMDHPFFATLLIRTPVELTERVPLAATDGDKIYYNPHFLEHCSVEDTMAVLAHEVGHDSLMHSLRLGQRNPDVANRAMDHAINLMLEDQGFTCPKVVGGWLADPKYKGWYWERIYDDIRREEQSKPKPKPQKGKGQPDPNAPPGGGSGDEPDEGDDGDQPGGAGGQPDPNAPEGAGGGQPKPGQAQQQASGGKPVKRAGYDPLHGDVMPTPAKDAAEQAQQEQRAKQRVAAAANMARMAGKLTGELARMVDDMLESKLHWTDILRDFMLKVVRSRESWTRRNPRYRGVFLPRRHEKRMGPIIFIPDTSGSMWGDDMEKICSEMAHCANQTQPENIRVCWADTEVKGEQVFDPVDFNFKALKPAGGGGTDMTVPLKYVERYDPQVVVLMTDGYTPWPKGEPPFPVIVICTTDAPVPIGSVIRI